jgi:hypothetical protein
MILILCAGSSANSLDASSTEAVNTSGVSSSTGTAALPVVIESTQQLTSKRPVRSEAAKERRSSISTSRYMNGSGNGGLHEGVSSSPSQNSIESTISSSSSDDVPPPLPAKLHAGSVSLDVGHAPPEKPALHNYALVGIEEDAAPPPPPPKKPARPLPPKT